MAYDYALVHLKFTVPVALLLTTISYPLLTRRHWYQTSALVLIAFVATVPWDSYLIRRNVWTYPPDVVFGPTLFSIPAEELFFFIVQTYITSLIYLLLNKPLLHAEYLITSHPRWTKRTHRFIQGVLIGLTTLGAVQFATGGAGTYMGLILVWACPFALLTWTLGGQYMLSLPWTSTVVPTVLPTLYLWIVDEMALGRGTWSIESGTKLNMRVWGSLEIEEAVFFLATNVLIVFGLGAFDNAIAVVDAFPNAFAEAPECPSPPVLVKALLMTWTEGHRNRIIGVQQAVDRLCKKSRSFYLASSTFSGRLRIDLVLLYSYCRMADDLVDEPPEGVDTATWISRLAHYLDLIYEPCSKETTTPKQDQVQTCIESGFPPSARSALTLVPAHILPPEPLYLLLEGFKTDSTFSSGDAKRDFPIADEKALEEYASQVAGTVGELCLSLIAHHSTPIARQHRDKVRSAARWMGIALQYVNVSRDIAVDAAMGRVYLPTTWLEEEALTPELVVEQPNSDGVERLRRRLLSKAFAIYEASRPPMEWLPGEARRPMIVAVESYMEIGRVLSEKKGGIELRRGRATVPKSRRLGVALRALLE